MDKTYTNPVYSDYFADPFVLAYDGRYYAFGTAPGSPEGGQFPVLTSLDLVEWQFVGYALQPKAGIEFWAPEVAYHDGNFYLYYSARGIDDRDHGLRVAISPHPAQPFYELEKNLVPDEPFTIDAHPFQDADGQWYLYYAQDFLTEEDDQRVGTGIVVDRLVDMTTLANDPRVVVRPHADWQLFRAQRTMYGAVYDWHTVEGPAVRVHNGRYYCFYSGGAWELENYGVSYVVADHPLGPYRRPVSQQPILQSVPGQVIGPGHNSFTLSPDGREQITVYHAWDVAMTMRRMCIDRLVWGGDEPRIQGPTWTAQPAPGAEKE
ncbi:MAG: glycoside hydrolase family 43 protein [bacterium]|nr:glycoside hydrolase family 43 protein [bacterium]